MGIIILSILFIIGLALQGSVLALAAPDGIYPDFLLVLVVGTALLTDSKKGAKIGLIAGLLQDMVFGSPLGFFAFQKMAAGSLAGLFADDIYKDTVSAPMLLIVLFSFTNDLLNFLLLGFLNIPLPYSLAAYLQHYIAPRILFHFILMGLIYPYLYRAHKRRLFFPPSRNEDN